MSPAPARLQRFDIRIPKKAVNRNTGGITSDQSTAAHAPVVQVSTRLDHTAPSAVMLAHLDTPHVLLQGALADRTALIRLIRTLHLCKCVTGPQSSIIDGLKDL